MSLHTNDQLSVRVPLGQLPHRLPEIAVLRLQLEYPLQKPVVTTDAQGLAPLRVCCQSDQIIRHAVVKAESRADGAADAVLLVRRTLARRISYRLKPRRD